MATFIMLVLGSVLTGYGWVWAFDQDRAWRWKERGARWNGISVDSLKRTSEWEISTMLSGLFFMGLGILVALAALCTA